MAGAYTLFNLFLRAQEKYSEGCNNFEEHFSWLEEVVATARQAFSSLDPAILPKTPRGKKKTQKRPLQPSIAEEAESPPAKRISSCSTGSNDDTYNQDELPPRRGRAASKIAQEKVTKCMQNAGNRKLRRPSTPEKVTRTSRKVQGSRCAIRHQDSPEDNRSSQELETQETDGKRLTSESQVEQVLDTTPAVDPLSSCDTPKKKRDSTIRLSVNLTKERWPCTDTSQEMTDNSQNITQIIVTNLHQENGTDQTHLSEDDCTYSALRLEDNGNDKSEEEKEKNDQTPEIEIRRSKEGKESSCENSAKKLCEKPVSSDKENKSCESPSLGEGVEVLPKSLEKLPKPIPRSRMTRTKQRELQSSSQDGTGDRNTMVSAVSSPHPVPKPRSTHTKQQKEMHVENITNEESGTHMLPPTNIANSRVTRTKTRAKEQDSSSEQKGSDTHFPVEEGAGNCKQTDSLLSEEIPKTRSTRTRKKLIDGENIFENSVTKKDFEGMTNTESQNPRTTRSKKREIEEQTVEQPSRSTRTKCKKVEELSEKDLMDQENQDSEDEVEIKSSQVEMNSTFVRSDSHAIIKNMRKHDCSVESISTEESSVKPTHFSASCTSIRSTQYAGVGRVTRSKVRELPPMKVTPNKLSPSIHIAKNIMSPKSPAHASFKRVCCTPNSDSETQKASTLRQKGTFVKTPVKHSSRLFASPGPATAYQNHIREACNEVEELTSEDCEVLSSPAQVTRHSQSKARRTRRSREMKINNLSKSPSPVYAPGKVIRLKVNHILSSGSSSPKRYSRVQPAYSSSSEYRTQKKIGTPNEAKRTGTIISGIASFIKVQPAKISREDIEEKKLLEMQRKRERVEETRKKKEELLKLKAEEQKRRNEERMRRVQEAREERERKAIEAKEQQEKDRKLREERQREEQQRRKQQLLAKKRAEEEAKARKIREQQEDERKRQEEEIRKLMEEEKRAEEAKRIEEEKLARLAEQRRLQEEEKKRKIAEVERIARERKELERLRLREAEQIAEGKQAKIISSAAKKVALNETYTASDNKENSDHNSTFTKTSGSSQSNSSGKEHSNKYEMTPDSKKTKKDDAYASNYNITDIKSDDSTDDETAPKKKIPSWALTSQLKVALINQEYYPPAVEKIFPPDHLLIMPDLSQMFPIQRRRFYKRTSSAIWNTPPAKFFESN